MDVLSAELENFLIGLGKEPSCVSEKVEHYVKHILHLLSVPDEQAVIAYYGLFESQVHPLNYLAHQRGITPDEMNINIENCLRKLAVTPEWQMIKQLI